MSHKTKSLIKCAKLMLNIVDFSFDDICWLAKLIEYVIMGGSLMPIIYMWWKLSFLIPCLLVGYFLVLIKLQFFHVATSFCAITSCLCTIVARYYSSNFSFTSLLCFLLCCYYLPLSHFLLMCYNCFLLSHCYLCSCCCFLPLHYCCTLLLRYLLLHTIVVLHFMLVLLAFV